MNKSIRFAFSASTYEGRYNAGCAAKTKIFACFQAEKNANWLKNRSSRIFLLSYAHTRRYKNIFQCSKRLRKNARWRRRHTEPIIAENTSHKNVDEPRMVWKDVKVALTFRKSDTTSLVFQFDISSRAAIRDKVFDIVRVYARLKKTSVARDDAIRASVQPFFVGEVVLVCDNFLDGMNDVFFFSVFHSLSSHARHPFSFESRVSFSSGIRIQVRVARSGTRSSCHHGTQVVSYWSQHILFYHETPHPSFSYLFFFFWSARKGRQYGWKIATTAHACSFCV